MSNQMPMLLANFHIKIQVSKQLFLNLASNWLAAKPPANQKPRKKILVNEHGI